MVRFATVGGEPFATFSGEGSEPTVAKLRGSEFFATEGGEGLATTLCQESVEEERKRCKL